MTIVLIVEDSEPLALLYRRQLEHDGYKVQVAEDGEEGLLKAKKFMPDIIILDIVLPKKSGLEVLSALKQDPDLKDIPVVGMSAFGSKENRYQVLELGAVEFFEKEKVDPKDISAIVHKYTSE